MKIATHEHADVVTFQELTPSEVQRLHLAGIDREYPYSTVAPAGFGYGVGLWSKYPISDERSYSGFYDHEVSALIDASSPITIFSTHLITPWPASQKRWSAELLRLGSILRTQPGALVDDGDFNATNDHAQFRHLLAASGADDGASQAGSGLIRTYPGNAHYPPLIGIDHVLTRGVVATKVFAVRMPGSDHRGLIARIDVPKN